MRELLVRLQEWVEGLHLMNTLGKQVAWLAVVFAGGFLYFRAQQRPIVEAPAVRQPLGGTHCILMAEDARRQLGELVDGLRAGSLDESSFRSRAVDVGSALDEASFECSVARSDAERAALAEVRGALDAMRGAVAGLSPGVPAATLDAVSGAVLPAVAKSLAVARPAFGGMP